MIFELGVGVKQTSASKKYFIISYNCVWASLVGSRVLLAAFCSHWQTVLVRRTMISKEQSLNV
jgi:hypothetical protein